MDLKVIYKNADFDKFKKDFPDISENNNNDNKKIWEYLIKNKELNKIEPLITFDDCDFTKFKKDYPFLCLRIKKNNDRLIEGKK